MIESIVLRDLQLAMLESMKIIHDVCVNNGIKYSLCGGSTIGAIVHEGFIPWDDDIDIMMDRQNYDRFIEVANAQLPNNLKLINYKNSKNMRTLISKIEDTNYEITYLSSNGSRIKMGLFIDITVLDKVNTTTKKAKNLFNRSLLAMILISRKPPVNKGLVVKMLSRLAISFTTERFKIRFGEKTEKLVVSMYDSTLKYNYLEMLIYCGKWYKFPEDMFDEYVLKDFEDTQFYVVKNYDNYLRTRYERNYLELPPIEQQVPHHGIEEVKRIKE